MYDFIYKYIFYEFLLICVEISPEIRADMRMLFIEQVTYYAKGRGNLSAIYTHADIHLIFIVIFVLYSLLGNLADNMDHTHFTRPSNILETTNSEF